MSSRSSGKTGRKARIAAIALAVPLVATALTSCSPGSASAGSAANAGADGRAGHGTHGHAKPAGSAPTVALSPAAHTTNAPVTTEITAKVAGGQLVGVTLTDQAGRRVDGRMRGDGSSWTPDKPLAFGRAYTAKVTAINATGMTTATTEFTTMPKPATKPIHDAMNVFGRQTYGVGMPIVVNFGAAIPTRDRASVERRLFVRSYPPQPGAWRWYSGSEVAYRPRHYWKSGTAVQVRMALGGLPIGGRVIDKDRTATFRIGRDMRYQVTDRQHQMTIVRDGKTIKKFPISMGKASTPSWSGHFVIMNRLYATVFDTLDQPGGYRVAVNYAERLTWSGMFFHSAPWSTGAQGHVNVSHGCVNLAPADAKWIYQNSLVGDPVTISGTPRHAAPGNGWTVWDLPWDTYIKGSALASPVTRQPRPSRSAV